MNVLRTIKACSALENSFYKNNYFFKDVTIKYIQNRQSLKIQSFHKLALPVVGVIRKENGFSVYQPYRNHNFMFGLTTVPNRNYFIRKKRRKVYTKELEFEGGDKTLDLPSIDENFIQPAFKDVDNIDMLDPQVQKIFSLFNADGRTKLKYHMDQWVSKVQQSNLDKTSPEVQVAALTILIRNQKKHVFEWRKDKKGFKCFQARIKARNFFLGELRKVDTDKFDMLCNELELEYKPAESQYEKAIPTKANLRKKVARDAFLATKKQKLLKLKEELDSSRNEFEERKEIKLNELIKEMKDLGVEDTSSMDAAFKGLGMEHMLYRPPKKVWTRRLMLQRKFELYGSDKKAAKKQKQIG